MQGIRTGRARHANRFRGVLSDQDGFGLMEMMVASTIGGIGFLAVAGLQLAAATQGRIAEWRTSQAFAAQQVFEEVNRQGYAAASGGTFTTTVGGYSYAVNVSVANTAIRVKEVTALVPAVGTLTSQTYVTRLYQTRAVPVAP